MSGKLSTYSIVYRSGGTENFKWNRVLDTFPTYEAARIKASEIEKMGYPTLIHDTQQLNIIGLPETFKS